MTGFSLHCSPSSVIRNAPPCSTSTAARFSYVEPPRDVERSVTLGRKVCSKPSGLVLLECKRKNPRGRRLARRREVADMAREVKRREQEAKQRPEFAEEPPSTLEEAEQRVRVAQVRLAESVAEVRRVKEEAREDPRFSPEVGFKVFPEVKAELRRMDEHRCLLLEARLEHASLALSLHQGGPPRSLREFGFWAGEGLSERNVASCSFLVRAALKRGCLQACRLALQALPPPPAPAWPLLASSPGWCKPPPPLLPAVIAALRDPPDGDVPEDERQALQAEALRAAEGLASVDGYELPPEIEQFLALQAS